MRGPSPKAVVVVVALLLSLVVAPSISWAAKCCADCADGARKCCTGDTCNASNTSATCTTTTTFGDTTTVTTVTVSCDDGEGKTPFHQNP